MNKMSYREQIEAISLRISEERNLCSVKVLRDINKFINQYRKQGVSLNEIVNVGLKWFEVYYDRQFEPFGCYLNY